MTTLNMGITPIANGAPFYLGVKKGFFAKQHLQFKTSAQFSGGTTIVPGLLSGQLQVGDVSWGSMISAVAKDVPLIAIAPGDTAGTDPAGDYSQLVTLKSSGITSLQQLAGKKIGLNTLGGIGTITVNRTLEKAGVDWHTIKYVNVPWPTMAAALKRGQIDAAWESEPFLTQLKQEQQINDLAATDVATSPNLQISVYLTTKKYYEANPDIIKRFQAGMRESLQYAAAHPDEVRKIIPTYTDIDPSVAAKMALPTFISKIDMDDINMQVSLSHKYGIIDKQPPASSFVAPGF